MKHTQYLIVEIGSECNLAELHKDKCPCRSRDRSGKLLTDEEICSILDYIYEHTDFEGLTGFHFYNEPLLEQDRIAKIIDYAKNKHGDKAKFLLWSNATQDASKELLARFDSVHLTDYRLPNSKIDKYECQKVIHRWTLDNRMRSQGQLDLNPCRRICTELIIDAYGKGHICCVDYLGKVDIGNVRENGIDEVVKRFQAVRAQIAGELMLPDAPSFCTHCQCRHAKVAPLSTPAKVEEIETFCSTISYKTKLPVAPAIVFTHYNKSTGEGYTRFDQRLKDWFAWNDELIRKYNFRVYVVIEKDGKRDYLPDYARALDYPSDMVKFNLSASSNYGIRHAIEAGHEVIIKTDVDIVFPEITLQKCLSVQEKEAIQPVHLNLLKTLDPSEYVEAPKATGTTCMLASSWRQAHMDERLIGYGVDDYALEVRIKKAGYSITRTDDEGQRLDVHHQPHISGTPQREFLKGKDERVDHWGRNDGGFNPANFGENRRLLNQEWPGYMTNWGIGGWMSADVAVVVCCYKIPEERLRNWIEWNQDLLRKYRLRVVLVTDKYYNDLPSYIRCAVYPYEMPVFSLSRCLNFGIDLVGTGRIIKTDIDVILTDDFLQQARKADVGTIIHPSYKMIQSAATKEHVEKEWKDTRGTLCFFYDSYIKAKKYNEYIIGYYGEDGDFFRRLMQGATGKQSCSVYHVAHESGTNQIKGIRKDHWNTDAGEINERRADYCREVVSKKLWDRRRV